MAEQDSNTGKAGRGVLWWTDPQGQDVISILRAVRAFGSLLIGAGHNRDAMHQDTIVDTGSHLEDLATQGLVILGYESPKGEPKAQAAPEGGAA